MLVSHDNGRSVKMHRQADRQAIAALLAGSSNTLITIGDGGIKQIPANFNTQSAASPASSQ
jgi:hypothetical protein